MDRRPGRLIDRLREYDMQVGVSSAVLTRAFVAESPRREGRCVQCGAWRINRAAGQTRVLSHRESRTVRYAPISTVSAPNASVPVS